MIKLSKITIEGFHNVHKTSYNLKDMMYFYGPNGSGKSTILQAIQLALLGYIPGTNKTKEAIFKHANGRVLAVNLELTDDVGECITIERSWIRSGSSIKSSIDITPKDFDVDALIADVELPIFNYSDFIDLTPNKLKDWFLNFLPSAEISVRWDSEFTNNLETNGIDIDDNILSLIGETTDKIHSYNLSGIEEIRKANEYLKDELSFTKREYERVQNTVNSLIYYDDVDMNISASDIKSKIDLLSEAKQQQDRVFTIAQQNEVIKTTLVMYDDCDAENVELDPRYIEWSNVVNDITVKINSYSNIVTTNQETMYVLNDKISIANHRALELEHIIDGSGVCPYNGSICEAIESRLESYKEELIACRDSITQLTTDLNDVKSRTMQSQTDIQNWIVDRNNYEIKKQELTNRYAARDDLMGKLQPEPEITRFQDYDSQISDLQDMYAKCIANEKYQNLIDTLTREKFDLSVQIDIYKSWIDLTGVNGLQTSVATPFEHLSSIMTPQIKSIFGDTSDVSFIIDTKSNGFSMGITRDGEYIPYNLLSSSEKCIFTLALMLGIVSISPGELKVILVDDLFDHLDDDNISKVFDILDTIKFNVQMIFAGVKNINNINKISLV